MRVKVERLGRTFQKQRSAERRKREKARMRFSRDIAAKALAHHKPDADGVPPLTKALRRLRAEASARKQIEDRESFIADEAAATLAAFPELGTPLPPRSAALCEAEAAWTDYLMNTYVLQGLPVPPRECHGSPAHPLRKAYDEQLMLDDMDRATGSSKHRQQRLKLDSGAR